MRTVALAALGVVVASHVAFAGCPFARVACGQDGGLPLPVAEAAPQAVSLAARAPGPPDEQDAASWGSGADAVDLGHADESFQVGLTGVAAQVDFSVVEAHAQVGDLGVEADALTARARVQLSLTKGIDLQVGATLVEGSAD